jgi:ABC-type branched-subunit amino acid transport system ATPase component
MTAAIIEVRDLVKRFDGFTAVEHILFAVEAGVVFDLGRRRRPRC